MVISASIFSFLVLAAPASTGNVAQADSGHAAVSLDTMVVTAQRRAKADAQSEEIVPSLGATKRTLNRDQIADQSQGDNASFDQTLYRFPGVVQDELDKRLHVRGEEANLQYRINDVLLPDGLLGFGQELSTRFVDQLSLIVGTLPAQYGGRTAGIIDIRTKSGADMKGGNVSLYGGSYGTINPAFEYGNTVGDVSYYATGGFMFNGIGMANPAASAVPVHDDTYQYKGLATMSWFIDNSSRLSLILSGSHSDFHLPNTSGQTSSFTYDTLTSFESSKLNENQHEQSYYEVLAYQKKSGPLSFQLSQTARSGDVLFAPDTIGDLMFNGVASKDEHSLLAGGLTADASYQLDGSHTLRAGLSFNVEQATVNTANLVFPATWNDSAWVQTGTTPFSIDDNNSKIALQYSCYLQDEWKIVKQLTVNYGLRFEGLNAYLNEYQLSPRINAVYQPFKPTTIHAGYGMYFTPPPIEFVPSTSISKFDNTTYAADPNNNQSSPVKSERYHYFDLGLTQAILGGLEMGLDGYYKLKQYTLDEGQFGPAMIFSPNNADHGYVRGVELTLNYNGKNVSAYGNVAFSRAMAYGLISGQFQFAPDEISYMQSHWYHLDHDQDITATVGAAYKWDNLRVYADALYGSGLYGGQYNTQELPQYVTFNAGIDYTFKIRGVGALKARFDIVNLFDLVYEIRDGEGIGVFAPQYLPRRGLYGGLAWEF
jgi:outer membrane receptor for ferrienterochelin and colicin